MPPVREASTKPRAATVLPAPVACSNQKRRAALGSSGCSGSWSGSAPGSSQSWGSSSGSSSSSSSSSSSPGIADGGELLGLHVDRPVAAAVAVALDLGRERDERPGQRVDLVGGEDGPVGQVGLLLGR